MSTAKKSRAQRSLKAIWLVDGVFTVTKHSLLPVSNISPSKTNDTTCQKKYSSLYINKRTSKLIWLTSCAHNSLQDHRVTITGAWGNLSGGLLIAYCAQSLWLKRSLFQTMAARKWVTQMGLLHAARICIVRTANTQFRCIWMFTVSASTAGRISVYGTSDKTTF